jgi:hypothetical protein
MPYYLTPYTGAGTHDNPFRPSGSDQAGWSAIDLRADKGVTLDGGGFGYALLWLPPGSTDPIGSRTLVLDKLEAITNANRNFLATRTGIDFSQDVTFQDIVESLLVTGRAGWWNTLRPALGRMEAWLGGERIIDFPVIAGGSITDSFTRANETPLATPWTYQTGGSGSTVNLSSNVVTRGAGAAGDTFYYYANGAGWDADQTCEINDGAGNPVTGDDWGPAVRVGSSGLSGYLYSQYSVTRGAGKVVSGTYSVVESATGATSRGTAYKISAVGSTLRYYDAGTENASSPATDTSLTTAGNGAGWFQYDTQGSLDNFTGTGEITAGGRTTKNTRSAPLGIEAGMNWRGH